MTKIYSYRSHWLRIISIVCLLLASPLWVNCGGGDGDAASTPSPSTSTSIDRDGDSFTTDTGDCDDTKADIHPGTTDICGDGIDQDCSGTDNDCIKDANADEDGDGDGFTTDTGDCDDTKADIHPGATDICGDGIDQDCSGTDNDCIKNADADEDGDGDGFTKNQGDCDDTDPLKSPIMFDTLGDAIDSDCDGFGVTANEPISTIAGNGDENGNSALLIGLDRPNTVTFDRDGNLYIADSYNNRIRKVDTKGIITTVAGNGSSSYGGDGGAATEANLYTPTGIIFDSTGNLYIVDSYNNRIRKVDTKGIITTVAGNGSSAYGGDDGAATEASLDSPRGIAFDSVGNLYIADSSNYRVRKVDTKGIITTVAGNGDADYGGDSGAATEASLSYPTGIIFDSSDNLYIADYYNHRIRKVDAKGIITTVAGNGKTGYNGDGGAATATSLYYPTGIAIDATGNLYIADSGNSRVRKVDTKGIITTVAGNGTSVYGGDGGAATEASLNSPTGIIFDSTSNLYIADYYNNRVRKVDTKGIITTVAGNGDADYGGDSGAATASQIDSSTGIAIDATGNLYIADSYNHRVRKVDTKGIITTVAGNGNDYYNGDGGAATEASLNSPTGIIFDSTGNLYIADSYNHRVRRVDQSTGIITTVAGNGKTGYNGDGGAATEATLYYPTGIIFDSTSNLYIADHYNNRVRKVDHNTGIITTVAGNGKTGYSGDGGAATATSLSSPTGIIFDSSGNLYIADFYNDRVRKVDHNTSIITTVAGNGDDDYSGDGGAATATSLSSPTGIIFDSSGNLYIGDYYNGRVRKINP